MSGDPEVPDPLRPGLSARLPATVTDADTATAFGSGDVPVLATPRLLAWLEAATVAAVVDQLPAGATTVGAQVRLTHSAASPVGARLEVSARLTAVQGRRLAFAAEARDAAGEVVGSAEIERVLVDRERFVQRVSG